MDPQPAEQGHSRRRFLGDVIKTLAATAGVMAIGGRSADASESELAACGIYCSPSVCSGAQSCQPGQVLFSCRNQCSGERFSICRFRTCSGFCYSTAC